MTENEPELPLDGDPLLSGEPEGSTGFEDPEAPTHQIDSPLPEFGQEVVSDPDGDPTQTIQAVDDVYVILPDGEDASIPVVETEAVEDLVTAEIPESSVTDLVTEEIGAHAAISETSETSDIPTESSELVQTENLDAIASELDDECLTYGGEDLPEDLAVLPTIADDSALPLDEAADPDGEVARAPAARGSRFGVLMAIAAVFIAAAGGIYFGLPFLTGEKDASVAVAKSLPPPPPVEDPAAPVPGNDVQPEPGTPQPVPPPTEPVRPSDPIEIARLAFQESYLLSIQIGFVGEVGHE